MFSQLDGREGGRTDVVANQRLGALTVWLTDSVFVCACTSEYNRKESVKQHDGSVLFPTLPSTSTPVSIYCPPPLIVLCQVRDLNELPSHTYTMWSLGMQEGEKGKKRNRSTCVGVSILYSSYTKTQKGYGLYTKPCQCVA